ncbi:MAG: DUF499 domain-containing protein [Chloroflexi bacterium]|nr:DUF499 domain-containing protein [Chloroflexota bacterium]
MATTNQERIGRGLEVLARGLEPKVIHALQQKLGDGWWDVIDQDAIRAGNSRGVGTNFSDPQFLLNAIAYQWQRVFGATLGKTERAYVNELQDVRNRWAHPKADRPFTSSDTERALDTMARLAVAMGCPEADQELRRMRADVLRAQYEAAAKQQVAKQATLPLAGTDAAAGLTPWREVIAPHPDVQRGAYLAAEFAADLGQVVDGKGSAEYLDPNQFFARTYLTIGLTDLLTGALQRLSGIGGEPVVELQTNFGGGKTHSMLALYHLVSGVAAGSLPGIEPILAKAGVTDIPTVRRAVLVGTRHGPAEGVTRDDRHINTLWGNLAWQLGGAEAFERLRASDEARVSPGADILAGILTDFGPALVLIDEWVTFVRQLWSDDSLAAGSFDANLSFAQSLTEAAKQAPRALLVASLPSSDIEIGGEGGRTALTRLQNTFGRVQSPWRPASAEEGFEIVRRRLFEPVPADRAPVRDAVIQRFADMYARGTGDFPAATREAAYQRRMTAAYPIHPELFDRLYEDWSTLERFQRTRGVLRLMASVIHALWIRDDRSPLILPSSLPLDEQAVQSEATRYLEDAWVPVIESDIDGANSLPIALDKNDGSLGRYSATRRVARTIYLGSAATQQAANRGVDARSVKLGSVLPGESAGTYGDALRQLAEQATYLYDQGGRYWYSTQPSVARLARDRAEQLAPEVVDEHIRDVLRKQHADRSQFARLHAAPRSPVDVPDEDTVGLVVLGPEVSHSSKTTDSAASKAARDILESRGPGPRRFRNMLVFLAAETARLEELRDGVRQHLAWKSIEEDKGTLTLDSFQARQIETRVKDSAQAVTLRVGETFSWLLIPTQTVATGPITLEPIKASTSEGLAKRAVQKLEANGSFVTKLGGRNLRLQLDAYPDIWRDGDVDVRQLWEYFATYAYLPRLRDVSVLLGAIEDGAGGLTWRDELAYAAGKDDRGRYQGISVARPFAAVADGRSLVVRPDVAEAQLGAEEPVRPPHVVRDGGRVGDPGVSTEPAAQAPSRKSMFSGTVAVRDPRRAIPELTTLAQEILAPFAANTEVSLEVEVHITARHRGEGFDDTTIRNVSENARTLKFRDFDWDE